MSVIGTAVKTTWRTNLQRMNTDWHEQSLWLYMVVVFGHWLEHLTQIYQVYVMGWAPKVAGGVLGLWFPGLAQAEVLHFGYNLFLLSGILLLRGAFRGRSRHWWNLALLLQGWHFTEHVLLQVQWVTRVYLFGRAEQTGIGQLFLDRVELHFLYNLLVFVPMVVGMYFHFYPIDLEREEDTCGCSRR